MTRPEDSKSTQASKRTQPAIWVSILVLLVVTALSHALISSSLIAAHHAPLADAAMEIKYHAAVCHLWFKEAATGGAPQDFVAFERHLSRAEWYAHAMLDGGEDLRHGRFIPLKDAGLRREIDSVLELAATFRRIAVQRLESRDGSEIGKEMEQKCDAVFRTLVQRTERVESVLSEALKVEMHYFRMLQLGLIVIVIVLGIFTVLVLQRYERNQRLQVQALRVSEEKYRGFFENSADAMLIIENQTFIDCNVEALSLIGYESKEKLLHTHPAELSPLCQPDGRPSYEKAEEMMSLALTKGSHRFEWEHRSRDGFLFPVEVSLTTVDTGHGYQLHTVWRDIRERKQAEAARAELETQLRQAQKMEAVGQMAGGFAHDFNNLLQVISGYAELLLLSLPEEDTTASAVKKIDTAARRGQTLINQLLAFSRRQAIHPVDQNLNGLIGALLNMIRGLIGEHISLKYIPGKGIGTVHIDRGSMEQALINLCVNARDAMMGGGSLTLETRGVLIDEEFARTHSWAEPGRYALLSVSDTGSGMSRETCERIFEPFFTTKEVDKGTGLGLSMVFGIVQQHGGHITVRSEIGKGTVFEIYLPTVAREAEEIRTEEPMSVVGGTETILVAEDDESVLALAESVLQDAGYTVVTARDGAEAVQVFENRLDQIDFAMFDVVMPKMGGRQAMEQVLSLRPGLPHLFASGYSEDAVHTDFIQKQGVHLLSKPYRSEELLRTVRDMLDERTERQKDCDD